MTRTLFLILVLFPWLGACSGTAQLVRQDLRGGEVALEGGYMQSVGEARLLMAEHCQGRFLVRAPDGRAMDFVDSPLRDQERAEFVCTSDGVTPMAASAATQRAAR